MDYFAEKGSLCHEEGRDQGSAHDHIIFVGTFHHPICSCVLSLTPNETWSLGSMDNFLMDAEISCDKLGFQVRNEVWLKQSRHEFGG